MKNIQKLILMLFVFLVVVSSLVFVSCSGCNGADGGNDCIVYSSCDNDEDCKDESAPSACVGGLCKQDMCRNLDINCGMGKCIPHDNPETKDEKEWYYCQCDEGAGKIDNSGRCLLKCNTYNDCSDFKPDGDRVYPVCSNSVDGGICNLAVCHGENSCPDGKICNETTSRCE